MLKFNLYGEEYDIHLVIDEYIENDNLYIGLITTNDGFPEPFCDLTKNIGIKCDKNHSYVDLNNNPNMIEWIIDNNLGQLTGIVDWSGYSQYPEVKFNMGEINKHLYKEEKNNE